jgi:hypothetical protein
LAQTARRFDARFLGFAAIRGIGKWTRNTPQSAHKSLQIVRHQRHDPTSRARKIYHRAQIFTVPVAKRAE